MSEHKTIYKLANTIMGSENVVETFLVHVYTLV